MAGGSRAGTALIGSWVNSIKTVVLLAALGGLIVLIGDWVAPGGNGALIGLLIGLAVVGVTYWFSDKMALAAARARAVSEADEPYLYRIVRELTSEAGLPMPKIYVTPATQPNAFATGRNPDHAAVAATTGILKILDEDELRAVLAHELSHVKNRDVLIGSIAAAMAMGITLLARMAMFGAMFGGRRRTNPIALLALVLLAPLAAIVMRLAISRSREYQADWSGAQLIGSGEPLARALEKIQAGAQSIPMNVDPAHATAYIVNPLSASKQSLVAMLSTHPPTDRRIARLRAYRPEAPEQKGVRT